MNFLFELKSDRGLTSEHRIPRLSLGFILALAFLLTPHTIHASGLIRASSNLGLVGYWSFNEGNGNVAGDSSGFGNTGIFANNTTWDTGKLGKAVSFRGGAFFDHINILSPASTNIIDNSLTISVWIKKTTNGGIIDGQGYTLGLGDGGVGCGSTDITFIKKFYGIYCMSSFPVDGEWHLLTIVADSGGITSYVDAVVTDTAGDGTVFPDQFGNDINLGSGVGPTQFGGSLDEMRIYDRALSASEVAGLYNTKAAARKGVSNSGLVGWWPMEENSGASIDDFSGNKNRGTLDVEILWKSGKFGSALQFNSLSQVGVAVPNSQSLNPTTAITVSAWIYPTSWSGNNRILQKGSTDNQYRLLSESGFVYFCVFLSSSRCAGTSQYPSLNKWTNVVGVYNGSTVTLYYNGEAVASASFSGAINTTSDQLVIGCKSATLCSTTDGFNGKIDDVRIYNRALSADEIAALANSKQVAGAKTQTNLVSNGLVGYWPFGGTYMNWATGKALDASGNGNDGNMIAMSTSTSPAQGKVGQAMQFNSVTAYIDTGSPSSFDNLTEFTYSVWIKPRSIGRCTNGESVCGVIMGKVGNGVQGGQKMIGFNDIAQMGGNVNSFAAVAVTGTTVTTAANTVDFNEWQHIAWTVSNAGQVSKIYKNGVAIGTTNSVTLQNDDQSNIVIGAQVTSGGIDNGFDGYIDEPRVYNRALTASEVKQLYQAGR